MATPAREYSLEYYLLEYMKYGGIDRENLSDLVSIVASLKNKYGITPFAALPHGSPIPVGLTLRYQVEATTLTKLINIIHDTPRLKPEWLSRQSRKMLHFRHTTPSCS